MLELKNVCAGYSKKQVLYDITADFEKGKITSIIGPNGCGKSTLLKTISNIIPRTSGIIMTDGIDLNILNSKQIAQKIAYLPQSRTVPDMTARQLVLHGRFAHLSYPRVYSASDTAIAQNAMKHLQIEHLGDMPLSSLSGGMRQKVYIALALAQDTDYILFDEPTTYLDIKSQFDIMNTIKLLSVRGKGIITVMHDLILAMQCSDKILLMNDGRIVDFDTPENIYNSGVIDTVFNVPLKRTKTDSGYIYFYNHRSESL